MKVKLSYSVDLDDIPDNIIRLLSDSARRMYNVSEKLDEAIEKAKSNREYLKILDEVDQLRKDMFHVDSTLEECYEIVRGYQRAKIQHHIQQHQEMEIEGPQANPKEPEKSTKAEDKK